MYYSQQRRGVGAFANQGPGSDVLGYRGDEIRMLAARDAAPGYLPFVAVPAPARTVAAVPVVGPARSAAAAVRRPVSVSVRRSIPVPAYRRGPHGVGAFYFVSKGLGSVSTFFENSSHPGLVFAAGDTWQMTLTGSPNKPVYISGTHDGRDMGKTAVGTTDANGRIVLNGQMTSNEVGRWVETFWIGSEASSPIDFEVAAVSPAAGGGYQPTSANVVAPLEFQGTGVTSNVRGMHDTVVVPDLRTRLLTDEQTREDSYMLTVGALFPPEECAARLRESAQQYCSLYPGACQGVNIEAVIAEVCQRYSSWYNQTLNAYWNLIDRTGSTPLAGAPPRPSNYVPPTVFTSGPGYAAQQSGATPAQALQASQSNQQPAQTSSSSPVNNSSKTIQVPPAASGSTGGGSSPAPAAGSGGSSSGVAATAAVSDFLSGSISILGYQVPVLAAGAGVLAAMWMFGGGGRR